MKHAIPTTQPFSFRQTLAFVRRFMPIRSDYVLGESSLTAAIAIGGRAIEFTISGDRELVVEPPKQHAATVVRRASDFIGAADDVTAFYRAANGDRHFRPLVEQLHGLHHVRFLTLEEIAVYCVMMQRAPIAVATTYRRRFLERFGLGDRVRAFPTFEQLIELDGAEIGEAIGNAPKGQQIANVVRGVAAIGESRLRSAPYAEARDALLEVPGIGPFSAAAILLRGLGRMDETPMERFEDTARELYGDAYDAPAIARRYGDQIGYWSFYLKTGVPRMQAVRTSAA
jgi:DNA-3-methyladenine glycosylase II